MTTSSPATSPAAVSTRPRLFERTARKAVLAKLRQFTVGSITIDDRAFACEETIGDPAAEGAPHARIAIHDARFWSDVMCRGTIGAAESYARGDWTSPDTTAVVRAFVRNRSVLDAMEGGFAKVSAPFLRAFHALRSNTKAGSRKNIAAHYDLGNDFFEAFLDPSMTYSSALFESPESTLEAAQTAKIDRLCQKLQLRPEDRVLEIGTGWGSFALHAAGRYGCHVTTTTISEQQRARAAERIRAAGLEDRITLLSSDYRDLEGRYDKLASIEMIEAVGYRFLDTYLAKVADLLEPDGAAALQIITIQDQFFRQAVRDVDFIKRYIFPGSFIPSINAVSDAMTRATDLRIFHLEDMAPHYAETLRRWRVRLEDNRAHILELGYEEDFLRMWSYYLSYCEGGFDERFLGVSQVVFTKPLSRHAPLLAPLEGRGATARRKSAS